MNSGKSLPEVFGRRKAEMMELGDQINESVVDLFSSIDVLSHKPELDIRDGSQRMRLHYVKGRPVIEASKGDTRLVIRRGNNKVEIDPDLGQYIPFRDYTKELVSELQEPIMVYLRDLLGTLNDAAIQNVEGGVEKNIAIPELPKFYVPNVYLKRRRSRGIRLALTGLLAIFAMALAPTAAIINSYNKCELEEVQRVGASFTGRLEDKKVVNEVESGVGVSRLYYMVAFEGYGTKLVRIESNAEVVPLNPIALIDRGDMLTIRNYCRGALAQPVHSQEQFRSAPDYTQDLPPDMYNRFSIPVRVTQIVR